MHLVVPQKFIKDPSFLDAIQKLETLTHHSAIDVRYATDVKKRVGVLIASLKLDELDSTIHEVHSALLSYVEDIKHDFETNIRSALQHKKNIEVESEQQFVELIEATLTKTVSFSVRQSVVKRLIKSLGISAGTLTALHHRTITSLLKREPLKKILSAAVQHEDNSWWEAISEYIRVLQPSDFEKKQLEILYHHELNSSNNAAKESKMISTLLLMGYHYISAESLQNKEHGKESSLIEKAICIIDSYNEARLCLLRLLHSAYSTHKFEFLLKQLLDHRRTLLSLSLYQSSTSLVYVLQQPSRYMVDSFLAEELSFVEQEDVQMNDLYDSLYFYCPMIKRYRSYDDTYYCNDGSVLLCGLRNIIGHHPETGHIAAALVSRYIDALYDISSQISSDNDMPAILRLIRDQL